MARRLPPLGFTHLPSQRPASILRRFRYWLIRRLAGRDSVAINCSTAEGVVPTLDIGGDAGAVIHRLLVGVPEHRPHLRKTVHFRTVAAGKE
jgi:hypothetical protein